MLELMQFSRQYVHPFQMKVVTRVYRLRSGWMIFGHEIIEIQFFFPLKRVSSLYFKMVCFASFYPYTISNINTVFLKLSESVLWVLATSFLNSASKVWYLILYQTVYMTFHKLYGKWYCFEPHTQRIIKFDFHSLLMVGEVDFTSFKSVSITFS